MDILRDKLNNFRMSFISLLYRTIIKIRFAYLNRFSGEKFHQFVCNICGKTSNAPISIIKNRESASCTHCGSNRRFRTLMAALSIELFGKVISLVNFEVSKNLVGIGMSDNEIYAKQLKEKFDYKNTYYHKSPILDIVNISDNFREIADFIISSDVFEHVPPPVDVAFRNLYQMLKQDGFCIFSVPYKKHGDTIEHYPDLYNYEIIENKGTVILANTTNNGERQIFKSPIFHGGDGSTLEMRVFSEQSLLDKIKQAGFDGTKIYDKPYPEYGILIDEDIESLVFSFTKKNT